MVRLKKPENDLSQEDEAKTRRAVRHYRNTGTSDLLTKTTEALANSFDVFHATLLRPYKENEIYGENFTEPPPELLEGEEVYKVETILNHRRRGRGYQYFVKWQGYPITDASWEPEHAFSNDGDTLKIYKTRHNLP